MRPVLKLRSQSNSENKAKNEQSVLTRSICKKHEPEAKSRQEYAENLGHAALRHLALPAYKHLKNDTKMSNFEH